MEKQLISPEQMNSLHRDSYNTVEIERLSSIKASNRTTEERTRSGAPKGKGSYVTQTTPPTTNPKINTLMTKMNEANQILQYNVNFLRDRLDEISPVQSLQKEEKIRQIKWNQYVIKKYSYQGRIMAVIIIVCFLFILLHGISPSTFPWTAGLLLSISFVYVGYLLWDLMFRDPLNFDEFTFYNYNGKYIPPKEDPGSSNWDVDASNCLIKNMEEHYTKL
jgi:hypothetical protein